MDRVTEPTLVLRRRICRGTLLPALAALLIPVLAEAGSTGTTQLHMPQGTTAGTGNGDFVSATTGGLDTSYHYYVEVPPGLSRLVIDVFDADVGLGGTAEAAAGRDRDRNGFNTTADYTLWNPSGAQRNTQFTIGNATGPANSDNAWLTFYDTTGDTVRDNFATNAYTNNDGTMSWATNWLETNDDNSATAGLIQVTGGQLRIQDNNNGNPSSIQREANLTGFTTATFSFDFSFQGTVAADTMQVQVSANGGTSWTTLDTLAGNLAAGSKSYTITSSIASNTRIRFIRGAGFTVNTKFFFVDNVQIKDSVITPGHWEVRVDESSTANGGTADAINAIGLRAHDGDTTSGGTELNVYADSEVQLGVNPPASGTNSRSYTLYPWLTAGCSASKNDFDYDSNSGTVGSMSFTSRSGTFTQSYASASLSTNNAWRRDSWSGWTSDQLSGDYGIWADSTTITSYLVNGTPNGNYTDVYLGNYQAAANPPTANPGANTFRIYLPTDAGGAPSKPYVDQTLTFSGCGNGNDGPNPPVVGQTSCYTVTVRVVNPAAQAITFSTASNIVTANVPGSGVVYAGIAQTSQGTIVSQPAVGGTGNITWNPGSVAAGATAVLAYRVKVTPTAANQRIPMTATPASGNGTRAQYVDETGNTTQTRATYLFGPLCELAATQAVITEAVVSGVHARPGEAGGVEVEWRTASEAGTAGFYLERRDRAARRWVRVSEQLLASLQSAPQGGVYRLLDGGASPLEPQVYRLWEVQVDGGRRLHGPFAVAVDWERPEERGEGATAHPATRRAELPATPPRSLEKAAATAGNIGALHLTVPATGLYYLRTADVAAWFGVAPKQAETWIAEGKLNLSRGGAAVAWYPDWIKDGKDDKDSKGAAGMFFYGQAPGSLYAAGAVYRLARGAGLRMAAVAAAPAPGGGDGSFAETLHIERDAFPASALPLDPDSDYWFWEFMVAGDPTYGHRSFALDAPGLANGAAGAAALTVSLEGATDSGVAGEHHVHVALNGTLLGDTTWQGIAARQATFPVPAGLLRESGNQVELTADVGAGAPYSIVYLESFDLAYRRAFRSAGDALAFAADGAPRVAVAGFSSPAVRLLDVADPLRPRWLTGAAVETVPTAAATAAPTYRLGFVAAAGARYLAAAPAAFLAPSAVRAWRAPVLRDPGNRADYLVIAPAALHDAAQRLADLRHGRGLQTMVVDLDQVWDEWNAGSPDPHALQGFLAWAWGHWSVRPRYVALAGTGTLDYRNLLGYGDDLVPPLMIGTHGGLFPSDNALGDVDGDGLPEMAVGRLPVLSAAELDAYTQKIAAYEAGGDADWARNVLMLADGDDHATSFAAGSAQVAAQLSSPYAVTRIELGATPLATARTQLFAALAQGASLVDYMGHGGLDRLSADGLLTNADVAALANGDRLPVLTAMTCTINRFAVPGVASLGELLVKSASGGAAAVWGPTGLADNSQSLLLAQRFYRRTSDLVDAPLGDRLLRSLAEFRSLGGDGALLPIYNLLGDPALRLRHGTPPPVAGGSSGE